MRPARKLRAGEELSHARRPPGDRRRCPHAGRRHVPRRAAPARSRRWRCSTRSARCRCRRTSTSASTVPTATRPSTPRRPARPLPRPPGCTSRRGARRHRRRRAPSPPRRARRRPRHVPAGQRGRPARSTACTPSATGCPTTTWAACAAAEPRRRHRHDVSVRALESAAATGQLAGRTDLFLHRGGRVPGRRRADDQLPPAAHDAADDDRRVHRAALARPLRDRARRGLPLLVVRRRRCCSTATQRRRRRRFRALHPVTMDLDATDGAARAGVATTARWYVPHAVLHARRHARRGQVPERRRLRGPRRRDRARQHVPPHAAPRRRGRSPASAGSAPFSRLGRPHADRQRRLPGLLAGAEGRRRRRDVPQRLRRLDAPADARARRRHPGAARRRHPDGPRRVPAAAEPART